MILKQHLNVDPISFHNALAKKWSIKYKKSGLRKRYKFFSTHLKPFFPFTMSTFQYYGAVGVSLDNAVIQQGMSVGFRLMKNTGPLAGQTFDAFQSIDGGVNFNQPYRIPIISVANPGYIRSKAANAIAATEIIS